MSDHTLPEESDLEKNFQERVSKENNNQHKGDAPVSDSGYERGGDDRYTEHEERLNNNNRRRDDRRDRRDDERYNDGHREERSRRTQGGDRPYIRPNEREEREERRGSRRRNRDNYDRDDDNDDYYRRDNKRDYADLGVMFGDGITLHSRGDNYISQFMATVKKIKEEDDENVSDITAFKNFTYLPVNFIDSPFGYSCIAMYYVDKKDNQGNELSKYKVYVHTFIIAATGRNINNQSNTYTSNNGTKYQPIVVAGDTWNHEYEDKVLSRITRNMRTNHDHKFFNAGVFVVQETVDPENIEHIRTVLSYGRIGCSAVAREERKLTSFNFHDLNPKYLSLGLNVDMSGKPFETINGVERKTGILADVVINQDMGKRGQLVSPVTTVGFNPEVFWSTDPEDNRDRDGRRNFLAVLNINTLEPAAGSPVYDIGAQTLGALAVSSFTVGNRWEDYFINAKGLHRITLPDHKECDLEDITALSYLKSKTRFEPQDDGEMSEFIYQVMKPKAAIGMVADYRGPMSRTHRQFINIALNKDNAHDDFMDDLDYMTDNYFSEHFDPKKDGPIIWGGNDPILLGVIRDAHGRNRDLSIINVLALYNLYGSTNPDIAKAYQQTFDDTNLEPAYKLFLRSQILKDRFGGAVKITGVGEQLIWNPKALNALSNAIADCGFSWSTRNRDGYTHHERPSGRSIYENRCGHDVGRELFDGYSSRKRRDRNPYY